MNNELKELERKSLKINSNPGFSNIVLSSPLRNRGNIPTPHDGKSFNTENSPQDCFHFVVYFKHMDRADS